MTVDAFNSIGGVLLAFLAGHVMQLSNTQIGFAISLYQLAGALSQPYFGWRADRTGGRWLGAISVAWTGSMMMLALAVAALTGNYLLMLIPFVLGAFGSGAFHPIGSMHATETATSPNRAATNLSVFFLMGQTGSAIMPALVGALLDSTATYNHVFTDALGPAFQGIWIEHGDVTSLLFLALIAIPPTLWMIASIPGTAQRHQREAGTTKTVNPLQVMPLVILGTVVTLRSLANPGMVAFLPRLFQLKGWTAAEYGLITGGFWLAGGLTGMVMSHLVRRVNSRLIIGFTLIASAPALYLLPTLDGAAAFIVAFITGALTGGSHSVIVALAQRLMPAGKGFASGLTLGFIFGTGALGTILIGTLADRIGIAAAYQMIALVMVGTGALAFTLPRDHARRSV